MTSDNNILEGGYIPGLRSFIGSGILTVETEDSWNLLSVPLVVDDYRKSSVYSAATSEAFAYTGSYQRRDTLQNGIGYWMKFNGSGAAYFGGTTIAEETVLVQEKWNMIGALSYPARISDIVPIPPTTISSNYFGYSGTSGYYIEDTLQPGKGYWVKVSNAGKIVLRTTSNVPTTASSGSRFLDQKTKRPATPEESFNTLTVKDAMGQERTISFCSQSKDIDLEKYSLPPLPPGGMIDVRFVSGRMLETADENRSKDVAIRIASAEYPITIKWNITEHGSANTLLIDRNEIRMKGTAGTNVEHPTSNIKLRLSPASLPDIPSEFALSQNYPNPFNPLTVIRYQLPVAGRVNLKIYNALGQEVKTLIDEVQDAGYKSVNWNASELASGVYFYRMSAGSYIEVKKMMMIK
jgi:hypothetical protein